MLIVVPSSIKINISLNFKGSYAFVGITSNTKISEVSWFIENKTPITTKSSTDGKEIILQYRAVEIKKLNLSLNALHKDFIGGNIIDYLKTSKTDFGEFVDVSISDNSALVGVSLGFAVGLIGIMALNH